MKVAAICRMVIACAGAPTARARARAARRKGHAARRRRHRSISNDIALHDGNDNCCEDVAPRAGHCLDDRRRAAALGGMGDLQEIPGPLPLARSGGGASVCHDEPAQPAGSAALRAIIAAGSACSASLPGRRSRRSGDRGSFACRPASIATELLHAPRGRIPRRSRRLFGAASAIVRESLLAADLGKRPFTVPLRSGSARGFCSLRSAPLA